MAKLFRQTGNKYVRSSQFFLTEEFPLMHDDERIFFLFKNKNKNKNIENELTTERLTD
jgi:hypothetical protein